MEREVDRKRGQRKPQLDGQPRVRRVIKRPGVTMVELLESQVEADKKTRAKLAAIEQAGTFLVEHAGEIDVLRAGRVEDRDAFNMDAGVALRDVTTALLDTGVEVGAIAERVRLGLIAQGSSDPNRMIAIARTYGQILAQDREALIEERTATSSAPVQAPASEPINRPQRAPKA